MVAEWKRTLDPNGFVSKRHCGNHATGPCEACMYSAADEQLIGCSYHCSTFLQTSGHFLRPVLATDEGVRRHMDALIGNMSPTSEAKELCRQEIRDHSISNWNAFDEATMRTDAWSSDEEHEPLPHRQGEAEREWWPLSRRRSRIGPHVRNSPSCSHGLDLAAKRTRACELIFNLHWRTIPKRRVKSEWTKTEPCLQGVLGMFCMLFAVAFNEMVINWSMTEVSADGILTDFCGSRG